MCDACCVGYGGVVYNYFQLISAHESAHVDVIASVITSLGGAPTPSCQYYNFKADTVQQFIDTSAVLEAVGVKAYAGAINSLYDPTIIQAAYLTPPPPPPPPPPP